jgi:drug/metabolite transporter (DMT)-like permease
VTVAAPGRDAAAWRVPLAAAGTGVQVGAALVATRFVVGEAGPASIALLRYSIGFLCLLPFVLAARRGARIAPRDLVPIGVLGIVQFGGVVALLNFGLQYIPAGRAALIFASFPLQAMLLAAALRQEPLTLPKTLGVALTVAGVGFALGEKSLQGSTDPHAWMGELAVLGSAFCGAICSVLYRPYLRRYPTLPISAFSMLVSVGFLAVLAAGEGFFAAAPRFTWQGWGAVAFIGVSSGVFYYLWLWALERGTATKVSAFLSLSPITAAALGGVVLGERVSVHLAIGLACVVAGLWLAHLRSPPRRAWL